MKKILVSYYSKHGHTRIIGKKIAEILKADIEEIIDLKDRSEIISWAESSLDDQIRQPTKIKKPKNQSSEYDLVIIGTPIWDGVTPPVKAYLSQNKFNETAFFATFGASEGDAFEVMAKLSRTKPVTTFGLQDRQIILKEDENLIDKFCKEINQK